MATAVVWHVNLEGRQAIPEVQLYVLVDAKTEILIYSFFLKKNCTSSRKHTMRRTAHPTFANQYSQNNRPQPECST